MPDTKCPGKYTNLHSVPVIAEKPYIVIDADTNKHKLYVPRLEVDKVGATKDYTTLSDVIDFENVYVSTDADDADVINAKLDSGLVVILSLANVRRVQCILNVECCCRYYEWWRLMVICTVKQPQEIICCPNQLKSTMIMGY